MGRPAGPKRRKKSRIKIVQQVIREFFITEEIFFSDSKWIIAVKARREAILRLAADGAYQAEIADLIKRERTMVRYHMQPHRRKRTNYYTKKWQELKKHPVEYQKRLKQRRDNWHKHQSRLARYETIRQQNRRFMEAAE